MDKSSTLKISKLSNTKSGMMLQQAGRLGGRPLSVERKKLAIRL